jgi:hypothetical protein
MRNYTVLGNSSNDSQNNKAGGYDDSSKSAIMNLAGDGRKYLVQFSGSVKGFYELSQDVDSTKNMDWMV